jgi:hypothetical protein
MVPGSFAAPRPVPDRQAPAEVAWARAGHWQPTQKAEWRGQSAKAAEGSRRVQRAAAWDCQVAATPPVAMAGACRVAARHGCPQWASAAVRRQVSQKMPPVLAALEAARSAQAAVALSVGLGAPLAPEEAQKQLAPPPPAAVPTVPVLPAPSVGRMEEQPPVRCYGSSALVAPPLKLSPPAVTAAEPTAVSLSRRLPQAAEMGPPALRAPDA